MKKWQLFFNNAKCKCIHFNKDNPKHNYYLKTENGNFNIENTNEEKDLGITFDNNLKFDIHITTSVNKANKILGLIKRNFKYIDKQIFNQLFKSLVRPHLEYGQCIWSPFLIRQSKQIENIQRRATKIVPGLYNLTYAERLKRLDLPSLKYRRLRGDLITVYNIFKSQDQDLINKYFTLTAHTHNTKGHSLKLFKYKSNTDIRKFSFSQRITNI